MWPPKAGPPQVYNLNTLGSGPLDDTTYHIGKALGLVFSDEKTFSCCSLYKPVQNIWDLGRGHFWPQGYYLNNIGRGPLGDATYQISQLYALWFQRRFLKFSSWKSIFSLCDLDMQWTGTRGHIRIIPTKFGQNPASSPLKQLLTTEDRQGITDDTRQTSNNHKSSPWGKGSGELKMIRALESTENRDPRLPWILWENAK